MLTKVSRCLPNRQLLPCGSFLSKLGRTFLNFASSQRIPSQPISTIEIHPTKRSRYLSRFVETRRCTGRQSTSFTKSTPFTTTLPTTRSLRGKVDLNALREFDILALTWSKHSPRFNLNVSCILTNNSAPKLGVADSHFHCDGSNDSTVVSKFLRFLVARDTYSWSRIKVRRTTPRNIKRQPEGIREPCQLAAPQIETLHINIGIGLGVYSRGLYIVYLVLREILVMCKNLKRVNVNLCLRKRTVYAPILPDDEAESLHPKCWVYSGGYDKWGSLPPHNLMIQINHLLGKKGSSRFQDGPSEFFSQCSWEAKEGEVFKINEHLNLDCELLTAVLGNACGCLRSD